MSVDSSKHPHSKRVKSPDSVAAGWQVQLKSLVGFPLWVAVSFIGAQFVVVAIIALLQKLAIVPPLDTASSIVNAMFAAAVYLATLLIVMGLPYVIYRWPTTRKLMGLTRSVTWTDILLSIAGAIVYIMLSGILLSISLSLMPAIDLNQAQDIGFRSIVSPTQYLLAFTTLIIVAPIAEELLFRGYLYGNLRRRVPAWLSILVTSILFGVAHMQWNIGIDTFALSIVLCVLREVTGSIWAGILLHMLKNGVAFYLIFIMQPGLIH